MTIKFFFQKLLSGYFYFVGLVVFFVLHRWNEVFDFLSFWEVSKILFSLTILILIYFFAGKVIFRNKNKSALFTLLSFSLFLFFSLVEVCSAFLGKAGVNVSTKLFLAGLLFLLFFVILFLKKERVRGSVYLNALFLVLVFFEITQLMWKGVSKKELQNELMMEVSKTDSLRPKPSVYLILLDEYAGAESLEKYYGFDNRLFIGQLEDLGFVVAKKAFGNYDYTVLSIASMLNGEYLKFPSKESVYSNENYTNALNAIYQNKTFRTFKKLGYKTVNYSPFQIEGSESEYSNSYLPAKSLLLLHPTVFDEIIELLPFYIARKMKEKKWLANMFKEKIATNYRLIEKVVNESSKSDSIPSFYYMHLMMPHAPFAVDSSGNINMSFLGASSMNTETKRQAYFQYLIHTNKVILSFISKLRKNTKGEAVIILTSDHGSRDLMTADDTESGFNSINALYYPGKDSLIYDGITNVNQFRILFSAITNKRIPLLKDSIVVK